MAGGGVGEAMLIGAAVGAGTGGIMSAAQDKDPLEGALLGAAMGAAGGGIGSAAGGALSGAATGAESGVATGALSGEAGAAGVSAAEGSQIGALTAQNTGLGMTGAEQTANLLGTANAAPGSQAAILAEQNAGMGLTQAQSNANIMSSVTPGTTSAPTTTGGVSDLAQWGQAGKGSGFAPGLTNAQAYGAGAGGGIMALTGNAQNQGEQWAPEQEPYSGSLSYFKYNPQTFRPSVAPGYADGGVASLQPTAMYPQSQLDTTQFAVPSQRPASREVVNADYDARINPYTGDMMMARGGIARYGDGGGIGFVRSLQPGGIGGDMTADVYGAQVETLPFLKQIEPGGFLGATTPGRLDYEDRKRKEEEEKAAQAKAQGTTYDQVIASMSNADRKKRLAQQYGIVEGSGSNTVAMARGGISSLGFYSDGGRMLRGPGDGMSDDIPGVIAGKQPARLADGEFVVPADVVSHLGNGSTDAGAKKLYSMMDNVRKARTGSKKQGKQIKAEKHMPGMASGGIAQFDNGGMTDEEAPLWFTNWLATQEAATKPSAGIVAGGFQPTEYTPSTQYSPYTLANRPSSAAPQYYGDIYQGSYPDYSTPGYTLAGNLGGWSNVAGEQARAMQPASQAQQVTQAYLQSLGRAPETEGFNYWMQSGAPASEKVASIAASPEAQSIKEAPKENKKYRGGIASLRRA